MSNIPAGDLQIAVWQTLSGLTPVGNYTLDDHQRAAKVRLALAGGGGLAVNKIGVAVPADWGRNYKAKLASAQAGTGKCVVAVIGDSISQAYQTYGNLCWAGLLKTALQGPNFGPADGGSGFFSCTNSTVWASAITGMSGAVGLLYEANGDFMTTTGTWTANATGGVTAALYDGPGAGQLNTSTSGSTITCKLRGTTLKVYYLTSTTQQGAFTVNVDGTGAILVTPALVNGIGVYTVAASAGVTHTVVLTTTTATGLLVCGFSGEYATGVVVNNYSAAALRSAQFNGGVGTQAATGGQTTSANSGVFGPAAQWSGGPLYPCDLAIYAMAANDINNNVAAQTYITNVQAYMRVVKNVPVPPDVAVLVPHLPLVWDTNAAIGAYIVQFEATAKLNAAALFQFNAVAKNSYTYWNNLGYWGNGGVVPIGGSGTDPVHPSTLGHAFMATFINPVINSTV